MTVLAHDTAQHQPSVTADYHDGVDYADGHYTLADVKAAGGTVTRLRLLREGRRVDVSYVHATLADGRTVPVSVAHMDTSLGIPTWGLKAALVAWAKAEGVYAKGLGLLEEGNWSIL